MRKRLFHGIAMALFGLAVFNLHYWGFGVPFFLVGAWYLVRAYRLEQALKRAQAAAARRQRTAPVPTSGPGPVRTSGTRPPEATLGDPGRAPPRRVQQRTTVPSTARHERRG